MSEKALWRRRLMGAVAGSSRECKMQSCRKCEVWLGGWVCVVDGTGIRGGGWMPVGWFRAVGTPRGRQAVVRSLDRSFVGVWRVPGSVSLAT